MARPGAAASDAALPGDLRAAIRALGTKPIAGLEASASEKLDQLIAALRKTADQYERHADAVTQEMSKPVSEGEPYLPSRMLLLDDAARLQVRTEGLESLYARAAVFAFLSEYEGFGLTPLEALSAGVPIIVLDTPIAREVYGEAAWFVPQEGEVRGATNAIRTLLEDPASAAPMLAAAHGVLARYSWDDAAERTLAGIEGIVRK